MGNKNNNLLSPHTRKEGDEGGKWGEQVRVRSRNKVRGLFPADSRIFVAEEPRSAT